MMKKQMTIVVMMVGLGLLAGCGQSPSVQESVITEAGVYFPQLAPMDEMPLALMYGQLINDAGCLRVVANEGGESYLILWPAGMDLILVDEVVAVQDEAGQILATVDQQIGLVGGEYAQRDWVEGLLQPERGLPVECNGPYWLTGEIIEPDI